MSTLLEISSPDSSAASILKVEVPFKRTSSGNPKKATVNMGSVTIQSTFANLAQNTSFNDQPSMPPTTKPSAKPPAPIHPSAVVARAQNKYLNLQQSMSSSMNTATKPPAQRKKKKVAEHPHVLLWICTHGKGRSRDWTRSALKVVGVYATKDDAQRKKDELMTQYDCCGHGDILVGGSWDDEIDLVIRPAEEVCL